MELSDLHIFRTVVAAGGVTRAAEKLHRVQSNVTTRIRQLEEDLGVELFIRQGKRLHLSPSGQMLLDYADRLLDLAQEARESVQDTTPRGRFRLGSMESTAAVRLPAPLSVFHRNYPEVSLELQTSNPQQLAGWLLEGEIDAALVAEPIADAPFDKMPIYQEELVIIADADHPPIRSAADVMSSTLLIFEPGCPQRKRLEDWFARQGELPARLVEMSSYHTMLGCVVAGMGITLLPLGVVESYQDKHRLSIHKLPPGENRSQTILIWRKGARSPKVEALIRVLKGAKSDRKPRTAKQVDRTKTGGKQAIHA